MKKNRKPSWWLLNGMLVGMIFSLFLAQKMLHTTIVLRASQVGIVVLGYWLMWRWLSANAASLEEEEERKQKEAEQRHEARQAELEGKKLNPQQVHYLKTIKAKKNNL
jgi:hypothetical protein